MVRTFIGIIGIGNVFLIRWLGCPKWGGGEGRGTSPPGAGCATDLNRKSLKGLDGP